MSWTTVWSKRLLNNPLVEETFELFLGWSFDATVEQNLEGGLASRYGNVGRAKDVITTLSRRLPGLRHGEAADCDGERRSALRRLARLLSPLDRRH